MTDYQMKVFLLSLEWQVPRKCIMIKTDKILISIKERKLLNKNVLKIYFLKRKAGVPTLESEKLADIQTGMTKICQKVKNL